MANDRHLSVLQASGINESPWPAGLVESDKSRWLTLDRKRFYPLALTNYVVALSK